MRELEHHVVMLAVFSCTVLGCGDWFKVDPSHTHSFGSGGVYNTAGAGSAEETESTGEVEDTEGAALTGDTGLSGGEASAGEMDTTAGSMTTGSTDGDGFTGYCEDSCQSPGDCLQGGMGDPADWECNEGFCDFIGIIPPVPPCDDTNCPTAMGFNCEPVDGMETCVVSCTDGNDQCPAMQECIGMDDNGNLYCRLPDPDPCYGLAVEGEPCEVGMSGQIGVCRNGECTCTSNAECTVKGKACRPME